MVSGRLGLGNVANRRAFGILGRIIVGTTNVAELRELVLDLGEKEKVSEKLGDRMLCIGSNEVLKSVFERPATTGK